MSTYSGRNRSLRSLITAKSKAIEFATLTVTAEPTKDQNHWTADGGETFLSCEAASSIPSTQKISKLFCIGSRIVAANIGCKMKSIKPSPRNGEKLTVFKDKAKELLGIGLPNNVVASAIGVSESLVSQWMSEEEFAKSVQEIRLVTFSEAAGRDKIYNSIEDQLLEKLKEKLESPLMFSSPRDILAAIRTINGAIRRGTPQELASAQSVKQFVTLQLPENTEFAARFVMNGKNQVVEVAGRPLATMGAKGVVRKLETLRENQAANKEQHLKDEVAAFERLNKLTTLEHLPVAEVL